jgi:hypothetical protein
LPATCTFGFLTPATTCALVTTRSNPTTTPLPSWPRPQAGASPVILTMLFSASATAADFTTAASGAWIGEIRSGPTPANTRGNVEPPTALRNESAMPAIRDGTMWSTPLMTWDDATARDSSGEGPPRTAPATNQATSATATTPAVAPLSWSATAMPPCGTPSRSRLPNTAPRNCRARRRG